MSDVEIIEPKVSLTNKNTKVKVDKLRVAAYCRVSTDKDDQKKSYDSQIKYYTDLINSNKDWKFAGIYADEAISGGMKKKRMQFNQMLEDAKEGKIDQIIVKSISRFGRNTLDTLSAVQELKELNVPVIFEEERINTLTAEGELTLTILSSISQQEMVNISEHVKKGLEFKMKSGALVGFNDCLGYDYDSVSKTIVLNKEEAEVVCKIFELYNSGRGGRVIAKYLNERGYLTKKGNKWTDSGVLGIIKNEKYVGDLLQGKTYTTDTRSKARLKNKGERRQYLKKDHHEAIVSREVFNNAQEILKKRQLVSVDAEGNVGRNKLSRQYPFSCKLKCGYCKGNLSRRTWHSGSNHEKIIWQCVKSTKKGKKYCPNSKGISEKVIEEAFVESYNMFFESHQDVLEDFIKRVENSFQNKDELKKIKQIEKQIKDLNKKASILLDKNMDGLIDNETYKNKYLEISNQIEYLKMQKAKLDETFSNETSLKIRMTKFKEVLSSKNVLTQFDDDVFQSIIDSVIVGGYNDEGKKDPYKLIFIYKTGFTDKTLESKKYLKKVCSDTDNESYEVCSHTMYDTCGDVHVTTSEVIQTYRERYVEILEFTHFSRYELVYSTCHRLTNYSL